MNKPTLAQQLRASVKLVKPELLADVPDGYDARQTFNFLRHKATNYEELLEQHRNEYGNVTPAEQKALTQGAADVIIGAFRSENADLLVGQASTPFAKFARKISSVLGLSTDIDLQAIHTATNTLKKSQTMYRSWNERYRQQKEMVLEVVKLADPDIYNKVKAIYSTTSKAKLDALQQELFNG